MWYEWGVTKYAAVALKRSLPRIFFLLSSDLSQLHVSLEQDFLKEIIHFNSNLCLSFESSTSTTFLNPTPCTTLFVSSHSSYFLHPSSYEVTRHHHQTSPPPGHNSYIITLTTKSPLFFLSFFFFFSCPLFSSRLVNFDEVVIVSFCMPEGVESDILFLSSALYIRRQT